METHDVGSSDGSSVEDSFLTLGHVAFKKALLEVGPNKVPRYKGVYIEGVGTSKRGEEEDIKNRKEEIKAAICNKISEMPSKSLPTIITGRNIVQDNEGGILSNEKTFL